MLSTSPTISYNKTLLSKKLKVCPPTFLLKIRSKKNASVDFLIHVLTNDPKRPEHFRQSPPKIIRINFFIITDILKTSISDINADGNGA